MMRINVLSFLCVLFALLFVVSAFETSTNKKDEKKSDNKDVGRVVDVTSGEQGNCGGTCGGGGNGGAGGHGGPGGNGGEGGGSGNGGPGGNGGNGGPGGNGGNGGKGGGCGYQCCDSGGGCKKCCAASYNVYVVDQELDQFEDAKKALFGPSGKERKCKQYCCQWKGGYCAKKCYRCLDKNGVWTEAQELDVHQLNGANYKVESTTNSRGAGDK